MCGCVTIPGVVVLGDETGDPPVSVQVGSLGWYGMPALSFASVTGSKVAYGLERGLIREAAPA